MILLTEIKPDIIKMEIKIHLPQDEVINFLQKKGYEVIAYKHIIPASEEFLVSEPKTEIYTFTATKTGEKQSDDVLYLNVFEKELKQHLKELK